MSSATAYFLLPEMILVLAATVIYLGGAFLTPRSGWSWLSAAVIVLAGVALYQEALTTNPQAALAEGIANAPVTIDGFSSTLRWAVLGVGLVFVMLAARATQHGEAPEFMGSLLLIVAGLMLIALANDLVTLFVALELVSIPTYVILFLGRGSALAESGTKYFFLSVLSSAIVLYGFSFLYGVGGSTNLQAIHHALALAAPGDAAVSLARLAVLLVFAGLGFRITIVPFHFYAPDVYQGTTNPNAGLLAVVPKIAGLVALVRLLAVALPGGELSPSLASLAELSWQISLALAIVTMTLGNLLALWQNNVRRLLAYSSIAHAGYMLIGLAVGFAVAGGAIDASNFDGIGATFFYLLVYAAATAGAFAVLAYLGGRSRSVDAVNDLSGLSQSFPKTAAAMSLFMFSLTGLPPLAGFWGKFALFTGALGVDAKNAEPNSLWPWFVALAIVGALNAAISAAYYLRIVGVMYFRPAGQALEAQGGTGAGWATAVCAALVVGLGCYPGPSLEQANRASQAARAAYAQPNPIARRDASGQRGRGLEPRRRADSRVNR